MVMGMCGLMYVLIKANRFNDGQECWSERIAFTIHVNIKIPYNYYFIWINNQAWKETSKLK